MFSWWNGPAREAAVSASPNTTKRRTVKERQVQVEVIGGRRSEATFGMPLPPRTRCACESIVGPPRMPRELITHIILLASDCILHDARQASAPQDLAINDLLRLASVDKASHSAVLSNCLLPQLCLTGARQVSAYSRALVCDTLNARELAAKVKRLSVVRITPADHANRSLYADVEETTRFERTTLVPLRTILHYCTGLEHLCMDMTARALDLRWPDDLEKGGLVRVSRSLKELVTMLSLYGGDLNERLWDLSYGAPALQSLDTSRWANLSHLQLHGPRFRLTALTALALCDLPQLTHLALVMPWIVNAYAGSVAPEVLARHAHAVGRAHDALGRQSVLQLLLSGLGHRLVDLLLVCHDIDGYLGSVQKLGPWFRALQWVQKADAGTSAHISRTEHTSRARLTMVTVRPALNGMHTASAARPHPSVVSKWMLKRARAMRHWHIEDGEQDAVASISIGVSKESWIVPIVFDASSVHSTRWRTGAEHSPSGASVLAHGNATYLADEEMGFRLGGIDDLD